MKPSRTDAHPKNPPSIVRQALLYFGFAAVMVGVNVVIQNVHINVIVPWVERTWGEVGWVNQTYLRTDPYNIPELIGSGVAVGITYILKFLLDKFVVFEEAFQSAKDTGIQFSIYFGLAILTTLENLGIQFLLGVLTTWSLNLRIFIALACGYATKFILDRRFAFPQNPRKSSDRQSGKQSSSLTESTEEV